MRDWTVLGIETSCDETAAAVVRGCAPGPGTILSNIVFSQLDAHRPYGGVVPEIAARAHVERLDGIVEEALSDAGVALADLDAVAAGLQDDDLAGRAKHRRHHVRLHQRELGAARADAERPIFMG